MTDNMKIWNAVSKTDPAHTKKVAQRGGFTAIDAHYQVMMATQQFGPVGSGWGYECDHGTTMDLELAWCDVTIWWAEIDNEEKRVVRRHFGPVRGMCKLKTGDRIDQDASKKAMTDALTKGLSHLGFSADVFLGLFDDNKYIEKRKVEAKAAVKAEQDMEWANMVMDKLMEVTSKDDLNARWNLLQPHLEGRDLAAVKALENFMATQRGEK